MKTPFYTLVMTLAIALSFCITTASAQRTWHLNGDSVGTADFIGTTNTDDLRIKTDNTTRMTVRSTGDLVVEGNIIDTTGWIHIDSIRTRVIHVGDSSMTLGTGTGNTSTPGNNWITASNGIIGMGRTAGTFANLRLGVGLKDPIGAVKLHLNSDGTGNVFQIFTNGYNGTPTIAGSAPTNGFRIGLRGSDNVAELRQMLSAAIEVTTNQANPINFYTNQSAIDMQIGSGNGEVGVGTAAVAGWSLSLYHPGVAVNTYQQWKTSVTAAAGNSGYFAGVDGSSGTAQFAQTYDAPTIFYNYHPDYSSGGYDLTPPERLLITSNRNMIGQPGIAPNLQPDGLRIPNPAANQPLNALDFWTCYSTGNTNIRFGSNGVIRGWNNNVTNGTLNRLNIIGRFNGLWYNAFASPSQALIGYRANHIFNVDSIEVSRIGNQNDANRGFTRIGLQPVPTIPIDAVRRLEVYDNADAPQLRITQTAPALPLIVNGVYTDVQTTSAGDLYVFPTDNTLPPAGLPSDQFLDVDGRGRIRNLPNGFGTVVVADNLGRLFVDGSITGGGGGIPDAKNAAWVDPGDGFVEWGTNPLLHNTEVPMTDPGNKEWSIYFSGQSDKSNALNPEDVGIGYPLPAVANNIDDSLNAKLDVRSVTFSQANEFDWINKYAILAPLLVFSPTDYY